MVSPWFNLGILPSLGYVLDSLPGASSLRCKSVASKSPVFTTLNLISRIVPAIALLAGKSSRSYTSTEPWNLNSGAGGRLSIV